MRKILIIIMLSSALASCSAYKIDIQQGNVLEPEQIAKLNVGMTKRQVTFLLGNPLLTDPFHKDRWDYIYLFTPGGGKMTRQLLTLYFDGGALIRVDDSQLAKTVIN